MKFIFLVAALTVCHFVELLHLKDSEESTCFYLKIVTFTADFYAPAMTMAMALSVTPVRLYVLYICTSVQGHPLSKLNTLIRILRNLVTLFIVP